MRANPQVALTVRHDPPRQVHVCEKAQITAAVVAPWPIKAVLCYYRYGKKKGYSYVAMRQHRTYYYRADLPRAATWSVGTVEYFIELVDDRGQRIRAHRSGKSPASIRVFAPPGTKHNKRNRSLAHTYAEYVDFFTAALGKDSYLKIEVDYRFLLQLGFLYSVRMGFGIFEGQGQITERLDRDPTIASVPKAFTYGYLEGELRFHPLFAVMGRLALGAIRERGLQETRGTPLLFGLQGRIRIGKEQSTNLVLGVNGTLDVGTEGLITLTIAVFKKWPMAASVIVTNLPLGRDLGVRFIYQLGWRPVTWVSLDALLGWNIRNINHSGPSFGLGATFRW